MIKEFLDYQQARKGLAENTIKAYRRDLTQFCQWAREREHRWTTLRKKHFDEYLAQEAEHGASRNTLIRKASALRSLTTWAFHEGLLPTNEGQYIQSPKREEKLAEQADTEALIKYLQKEAETPRTERTQALIAFIMSTGARIQEALDAKLSDIDAAHWTIKLRGKGNRERTAYLQPWTLPFLSKVGNQRQGYIFPMKSQRTARYEMFQELEGYTQTHPHAIRHSFATNLLENGAEIKAVSLLLGHKSVKTTERYLNTSNNYLKTQLETHLNYGREEDTTEKELR